jgi:hypothetical protein
MRISAHPEAEKPEEQHPNAQHAHTQFLFLLACAGCSLIYGDLKLNWTGLNPRAITQSCMGCCFYGNASGVAGRLQGIREAGRYIFT